MFGLGRRAAGLRLPLHSSSRKLMQLNNSRLAGSIEYPMVATGLTPKDSKPILTLRLSKPEDLLLAVKPYHTINQLSKFIASQDPSISSITVYHRQAQDLEKWSQYTTIEDVVSFALRAGSASLPDDAATPVDESKKKSPRLFIKLNDNEISFIRLPSLEERLEPYQSRLAAVEAQMSPLDKIKASCDKKASRHSNRLVYGGLAGLFAQWTILARLTWWEYSWDVIEPITWFTGMGNSIFAYVFFVLYRKDFTCEVLSDMTVTTKQMSLYAQSGMNIEQYRDLKHEREHLEKCILEIKQMY